MVFFAFAFLSFRYHVITPHTMRISITFHALLFIFECPQITWGRFNVVISTFIAIALFFVPNGLGTLYPSKFNAYGDCPHCPHVFCYPYARVSIYFFRCNFFIYIYSVCKFLGTGDTWRFRSYFNVFLSPTAWGHMGTPLTILLKFQRFISNNMLEILGDTY